MKEIYYDELPDNISDLQKYLSNLNKMSQVIDKNMSLTKCKIRNIQNNTAGINDIARLEEIRDYICKNGAYFGNLNLKYLYHATPAYDIELYKYPLQVTGASIFKFLDICDTSFDACDDISKFVINHISNPSNDIEKRLYPHIVRHLQPYLPIQFEKYIPNYDDDGYRLRTINNAPIQFTKKDGAFISVYYLSRMT